MILPTKGISSNRALLSVGADILPLLDSPRSINELWEEFHADWDARHRREKLTFDWFALALATLYAMNVVELTADSRLRRTSASP